MLVCIPITRNEGLQSPVSPHFGSSPLFMMVDTASGACRAVENRDLHHEHGMCQPLRAVQGEQLEAVVVGGIGAGALAKLQAAHVQVFLSGLPTVEATLAALRSGTLRPMTPALACGHHHGERPSTPGSHGSGCCQS